MYAIRSYYASQLCLFPFRCPVFPALRNLVTTSYSIHYTKLYDKEEIAHLKARKESILSRLKVLLSSEVELIRALEIDDDEIPKSDPSHGTGKEDIAIDESYNFV